jgi:hypothetical protein
LFFARLVLHFIAFFDIKIISIFISSIFHLFSSSQGPANNDVIDPSRLVGPNGRLAGAPVNLPNRFLAKQNVPLKDSETEWVHDPWAGYEPNLVAQDALVSNAVQRVDFQPPEATEKPTVFCRVMTNKEEHWGRVQTVKNTWGRGCTTLMFLSSEDEPSIPAVKIPTSNDVKENLWEKSLNGWNYTVSLIFEFFFFFFCCIF